MGNNVIELIGLFIVERDGEAELQRDNLNDDREGDAMTAVAAAVAAADDTALVVQSRRASRRQRRGW